MATTVNTETLKRLIGEVGEDTVSVLLTVFSDELESYQKQLNGEPSLADVREISHAIKSSAASFGADELAELAQECEARVKSGQEGWMQDHLPEFTEMVQNVASTYKSLAEHNDFLDRLS